MEARTDSGDVSDMANRGSRRAQGSSIPNPVIPLDLVKVEENTQMSGGSAGTWTT